MLLHGYFRIFLVWQKGLTEIAEMSFHLFNMLATDIYFDLWCTFFRPLIAVFILVRINAINVTDRIDCGKLPEVNLKLILVLFFVTCFVTCILTRLTLWRGK